MLTNRPHRRLAQLLALACVASALVLVPLPRIAQAVEAQTSTERVALDRPAAARPAQAMSAAVLAEPDAVAELTAPDRHVARRSVPAFEAIGVTVAEEPDRPIFVRGRVAGAWTPWVEAHFAPEEAPDAGVETTDRRAHSQPVWLGGADAYEIDGPATLPAVDVHLVRERVVERRIVVAHDSAAAAAPSILSRSVWGARPPKEHPVASGDLKIAIVHHSVNANTYSSADVPALLRSIQAYHMDVNGWNDIAYNFAVDRFGRTWEARGGGIDQVVTGGHSAGFNTGSTGVVVLGDFRTSTPPSAAVDAVARVVAWKLALHRVEPGSKVPYTTNGSSKYAAGTTVVLPRVVGHRDVQSTTCPGERLYTQLGTIRTKVGQLVPQYQPDVPGSLLRVDRNGDGQLDPFEYHPGSTMDQWWTSNALGGFTKSSLSVRMAYRPAVGDFDGDGRQDVLWHATGTARDYIWWSRATGTESQALTVDGSHIPIVGDFDGNGADDIFWYTTGPGADRLWYHAVGGGRSSVAVDQPLFAAIPLVGRFDGDDRDDIFWYSPGSGTDSLWRSTGRGWSTKAFTVNLWYRPVVLDVNGDGVEDIQWVSIGSTSSPRWEFKSDGSLVGRTVRHPAVDGDPVVGDYDGDGLDDLFVFGPGNRADGIWYSTPTGVDARSLTVTRSYIVVGGPLAQLPAGGPDAVLLVSAAGDYLWRGNANRTFTSTRVG